MTIDFISTFHQSAGSYLSDTIQTLRLASDVHIELVDWHELWTRLKTAVNNRQGNEVSEIGTTRVASLTAMDAITSFTAGEVLQIGQAADFIPAAWQTAFVPGDPHVWAIPWTMEVRLIYYWQDLFERARIQTDENGIFQTSERMETVFEQVQTRTGIVPWVTTTGNYGNLINFAVPWIWGAGGDFLSDDHRHTRFAEPEALAGIINYFRLHRFLPPARTPISHQDAHRLFATRQAAATMYGPTLLKYLRDNLPPQQFEQLRVALPPGPPFIGRSNLIIMKHLTPIHRLPVIKLIAHLTSPPVQMEYAQLVGALPARSDVFNAESWSTDPLLKIFAGALHQGRSLSVSTLWSVISDRMDQLFAEIWSLIQANPDENLEQVIVPRIQQLAQRVDAMLE